MESGSGLMCGVWPLTGFSALILGTSEPYAVVMMRKVGEGQTDLVSA